MFGGNEMFSAKGSVVKYIARKATRLVVGLIRKIKKPDDGMDHPPWPIASLARLSEKRMRKNGPNVKEMRLGYRLSTYLFNMDDKPMHNMAEYDIGGGIKIRMYRPKGLKDGALAPAMAFFHGGGFVIGNLDTHDTICRYLAHKASVVIFAVHYRLAPEHKFPAAIEDATKAMAWLRSNADDLNIDKKYIGAGGDSAGAGISLALGLVDKRQDRPNFLWLVYPPVDMKAETASKEKHVRDLFLTTGVVGWFGMQFLPKNIDMSLPIFSPLTSLHLKDLPPTYIMTVGFDPLCDEGILLADKAKELGVDIRYKHYPRLAHEIFAISGIVPEAKEAIRDAAEELKKLANA
jgi:acetyl esterase